MRVKSAQALLQAYQEFKSNPDIYYHLANVWPDEDWSWLEFRAWFMKCLHAKINRLDARSGRCYTPEYQVGLRRDCDRIKEYYQKRIIHSGCNILETSECKHRYPHIDSPNLD